MTTDSEWSDRFTILGAELLVAKGKLVYSSASGGVISDSSNRDWVLYGPFKPVPAGFYCVRPVVTAEDVTSLEWDVYSWKSPDFQCAAIGDRPLYLRLPAMSRMEVRFRGCGSSFEVRAVEVELFFREDQPPEPERLEGHIISAIDQRADPAAIFHMIDALALTCPRSATELRDQYVQGKGRPYVKVLTRFKTLNTPGCVSLPPLPRFEAPKEEIRKAVEFLPLQRVDLLAGSPNDENLLFRHGYKAEFLQATARMRDYQVGLRPWQVEDQARAFDPAAEVSPMEGALSKVDLSFQDALCSGSGMIAYCPVSGERLISRHGFCWPFYGLAQTFYRFDGIETFYVVTGGFPNTRMFIYLPSSGILAICEKLPLRWYPYEDLLREFIAAQILHGEVVLKYLVGEPRLAAVYGLNNLGHFFWNEVGGLHWAARTGLISHITETVEMERQYIDVRAVITELEGVTNTRVKSPEEMFLTCMERALLPVRLTDARVVEDLAQRLERAARERSSPAPDLKVRPVLVINLRAHNKIWVNQVSGYAEILNALALEYGRVAVYFDGTADCADLVSAIRKELSSAVDVFDGLNVDLMTTLAWAFEADAFICPIGSGLVLTNWLANKPGVTHAEHGHMQQLNWWRCGRAEGIPPLAPRIEDIRDLGQGWYCDYEIEWSLLLKLVRQALHSVGYEGAMSTAIGREATS